MARVRRCVFRPLQSASIIVPARDIVIALAHVSLAFLCEQPLVMTSLHISTRRPFGSLVTRAGENRPDLYLSFWARRTAIITISKRSYKRAMYMFARSRAVLGAKRPESPVIIGWNTIHQHALSGLKTAPSEVFVVAMARATPASALR